MSRFLSQSLALLMASAIASLALVDAARSEGMRSMLGSECFARAYSANHLARHSRQLVKRIQLMDASDIPDDRGAASSSFRVHIEVALRGGRGTGAAIGYCTPDREGAACNLEGDAGGVTVRQRPDGRIAVVVTERGMIVETETTTVDLAESDDRQFLLAPSTGCVR